MGEAVPKTKLVEVKVSKLNEIILQLVRKTLRQKKVVIIDAKNTTKKA